MIVGLCVAMGLELAQHPPHWRCTADGVIFDRGLVLPPTSPILTEPMIGTRFLHVVLVLLLSRGAIAQRAVVPAGGEAGGTGGTVSWTVGQIDVMALSSAGGVMQQGVQQPVEWLVTDEADPAAGLSGISVVPNPAQHGATLHIGDGGEAYNTYVLLDASGRRATSGACTNRSTFIPLAGMASGTYYLLLQSRHGTATLKLIKR